MIAGRTRFYLVAGTVGASLGEVLGGALAIGAAWLPLPDGVAIVLLPAFLVSGVVGGAWAGVALMRRSYRRSPTRPA